MKGGLGNDTLTGETEASKFAFAVEDGSDTVTDFEDGTDTIVITIEGLSFTDETATTDGANTVLSVTEATATVSITLNGVGTGLITAEDFLFA